MQIVTETGITEEPDLEATLKQLAQIGYLAEQQPLLQLFLDFDQDKEEDCNETVVTI